MQELSINLLGGVDRRSDPIATAEGRAHTLKNLYPVQPGLLSKRHGMVEHRRVATGWQNVRAAHLSRVVNGEVIALVKGANSQRLTGATYANDTYKLIREASYGSNDTVLYEHTGDLGQAQIVDVLNDILLLAEGLTTPVRVSSPYTSGATVTWTGTPPAGFAPHLAAVKGQRVVYAWGNTLVWSDIGEPYVVGPEFAIDPFDKSPITAIARVESSSVSNPSQDVLLVWTHNRCYIVSGDPDETTETNLTVPQCALLYTAGGCVGQHTVVHTKRGVIWCGLDDVWIWTGNGASRVGMPIVPEILKLPQGLRWKAHAAWNPDYDCYQLALPMDGQDITEDYPLGWHWMLDLRADFAQPTWFGPQEYKPVFGWTSSGEQYGTSVLLTDTYSAQPKLFSIIPQRAIISTSTVVHLAMVRFDGRIGIDSAHPVADAIAAVREPLTAYSEAERIQYGSYELYATVGTTAATLTDVLFASLQTHAYLATGTISVVDGTVTWVSAAYVIDYNNMVKGYYTPSASPRFVTPYNFESASYHVEIKTRQYTGKSVILDKRPDSVLLGYYAGTPQPVNFHLLPWLQGVAAPGVNDTLRKTSLHSQNQVASLGTLYDQYAERVFGRHTLAVPYNERRVANHIQLRLTTKSGIVIDNSNNVLRAWAILRGSGLFPTDFALHQANVTIPSGTYGFADLLTYFNSLADTLIADVNTAYGDTVIDSIVASYVTEGVFKYTVNIVSAPAIDDATDILVHFFWDTNNLQDVSGSTAHLNLGWSDEDVIKQRNICAIFGQGWRTLDGDTHTAHPSLADYDGVVRGPHLWYSDIPKDLSIGQAVLFYDEYERLGLVL